MAKKSTKTGTRKRPSAKRDLVKAPSNKRYVKRTAKGRFKDSDDVSRSLSTDQRRTAKKKTTKSGYGDQRDRTRSSKKR